MHLMPSEAIIHIPYIAGLYHVQKQLIITESMTLYVGLWFLFFRIFVANKFDVSLLQLVQSLKHGSLMNVSNYQQVLQRLDTAVILCSEIETISLLCNHL